MQLDMEVGGGEAVGGLIVFPLLQCRAPVTGTYVPGPDAFAAGLVAVTEAGVDGEVNELVVANGAAEPVLLIEGETLLGGKQDRTLNLSVLCPPGTRTRIPVSCVEPGRWGHPGSTVRSVRHAPARLRAVKTAGVSGDREGRGRGDQAAVWREVSAYRVRAGLGGERSALEEVHDAANPGGNPLDLVVRERQIGVAVATGGRLLAVDLFDREETLRAYLPGLIAGYGLDAEPGTAAATAADVEDFLAVLRGSEWRRRPSVGLGQTWELVRTAAVGSALELDGTVVHMAAFPRADSVGVAG